MFYPWAGVIWAGERIASGILKKIICSREIEEELEWGFSLTKTHYMHVEISQQLLI